MRIDQVGHDNGFVSITPDAPQVIVGRRFNVRVSYTASASVPLPVSEATALIAAASYEQSSTDISGLKGEKIGDYSYTLGGGAAAGASADLTIPERAYVLLAPYSGRRGVRST